MDSVSPTVFCISEVGDLIKWFDCSDYMREPSDIAIFNNEYFVCDFKVFYFHFFGKNSSLFIFRVIVSLFLMKMEIIYDELVLKVSRIFPMESILVMLVRRISLELKYSDEY